MRVLLVCCLLLATGWAERLVWEDNFDWLDEGKWWHMVTAWRGGNEEFQYYRNNRKNSWTENGVLKIRPTPVIEELSDNDIRWGYIEDPGCNMQPCRSQGGQGDATAPVFSARLHSTDSFTTRFGRVEVRAKLPDGDWLWPAIWLLPHGTPYGDWPRSGEIDIVESRGNRHINNGWGDTVGTNYMESTLHWGPSPDQNMHAKTHWERRGPYLSDDFHTYELEWTQDHIKFSLDGQELGSVYPPNGGFWEYGGFQGGNIWGGGSKMAPFDTPFDIIMNVAVGGMYFGDDLVNEAYPKPWTLSNGHPLLDFYEAQWQWQPTWARPVLEVDYVRVYEL